ncbi:MAG TPA: hypothetical protein VKG79_12115 [Bryobacteraceae bacterium]|nr:hypothetical protein [Bryobacteraceae bacterium]
MNAVSVNGGVEGDRSLPGGTPGAQEATADAGAGNIDKIREIIFGSNMRDYDTRFARLEEALRKESLDMREAMRQRLETLESFVHKELAALDARLNTERDERSESHSRLANELSSASASIFKKIGDFESQEAQAKREIRNDMLQQSKELTEALRAKSEELVALLERRAHDLQHSKTDRTALAGMFNELALRLTDQFKVTGV